MPASQVSKARACHVSGAFFWGVDWIGWAADWEGAGAYSIAWLDSVSRLARVLIPPTGAVTVLGKGLAAVLLVVKSGSQYANAVGKVKFTGRTSLTSTSIQMTYRTTARTCLRIAKSTSRRTVMRMVDWMSIEMLKAHHIFAKLFTASIILTSIILPFRFISAKVLLFLFCDFPQLFYLSVGEVFVFDEELHHRSKGAIEGAFKHFAKLAGFSLGGADGGMEEV